MRGTTLRISTNVPGIEERLEFVVGSLQRFDRPVTGARGAGGAALSLWDHMATSWQKSRVRMFASLGRDTESPWPTYEQTEERLFYQHWKRAILGDSRYATELRWPDTDRIWRSLCEPGNRYYVDTRSRTKIELGSSLPYAAKHDRGEGRAPRALGGHPIPRRPLTRIGRWLTGQWERDLLTYADDIGASIGAPLTGAQARLLPLRRALA